MNNSPIVKQTENTYIDTSTGEVISYKKETQEDIINRLWDDKKGYILLYNAKYGKKFDNYKFRYVIKDKNDCHRILSLTEYVYQGTNKIFYEYYTINKNGNPVVNYRIANDEDIAEMLGLSLKRTKSFLNRMMNLGVIAKSKIQVSRASFFTGYVFNPLLYNSGKFVSPELYLTFEESLRKIVPDWVKKRYDLVIRQNDIQKQIELPPPVELIQEEIIKEILGMKSEWRPKNGTFLYHFCRNWYIFVPFLQGTFGSTSLFEALFFKIIVLYIYIDNFVSLFSRTNIWAINLRAAIRDGNPITVYIPSKRMRELLEDWLVI